MLNINQIVKHINRNHYLVKELAFGIELVSKYMIDRLDYIKISPDKILDLGYGIGIDYLALNAKYPKADIYGLDLSIKLLKNSDSSIKDEQRGVLNKIKNIFQVNPARLLICGDANHLPINHQSIDLVWSNLSLPFIDDYKGYFSEINRVLKLGGTFLVSGLGVDSLKELRDLGLSTFNFPDMHLIGDILVETGFSDPVTDVETITLEYDNFDDLLMDIKIMGCGGLLNNRITKAQYQDILKRFDGITQNGKIPLTLEFFYAHGWKDKIRNNLVSGSQVIYFKT